MGINVFWGAGKTGSTMCQIWKSFGIRPDYIFDNNKELEGTFCNGILISEKEYIKNLDNPQIFITCKCMEDVYRQLREEYGFTNMIKGNNAREMVSFLLRNGMAKLVEIPHKNGKRHDVLWDLENGMVLGGVESWTMESAKGLSEIGYVSKYLSTDFIHDAIADEGIDSICIPYVQSGYVNGLSACYNEILENAPCTVICNFAGFNFFAACAAKRTRNNEIKVIAVVHNDDKDYYNRYVQWEDCIDYCIVISSRMKRKLIQQGMQERKIRCLIWQVACTKDLERPWSKKGECLRIGYAGRVTVTQKRADMLPELAAKLKNKGIYFQLNIAGTGDYGEMLHQRIQEEDLQECMVMVGYISRERVPDFWEQQDIMVSCSEWEGHSISQTEAMMAGAVPVITDVSGARDDVTDGYNGFIVDVGDMDAIVDRICILYSNRRRLEQMGRHAHDTIYKRQENMDQALFWKNLLKAV